MKWNDAKAELIAMAGEEPCVLRVEEWRHGHGSTETVFGASVWKDDDWHIANGPSLRNVLDKMRAKLELDQADPTDEIGPSQDIDDNAVAAAQ